MKLSDTDPAVLALQDAISQQISGSERYAPAREMSERVRQLTLAGLQAEHPEWSERELMLEMLRLAMDPQPLPAELKWSPAKTLAGKNE